MANVVVAVGALMLVVGLYAIISGARIIQIEEGWASVIAGASLVAGGAVTTALGFVIRSLRQLRLAIAERPAAPAAEAPATEVPSFEAPPQIADEPPPVSLPSQTTHVTSTPAPPPMPPLPRLKPVPVDEPVGDLHEQPQPSPAPEPVEAFEAPPQHPTEAAHPADDYKLETPSSPEHDLPPAEPPVPPVPPKEDDWLDHALAEIDKELPIPAPARQVEAPVPKTTPKSILAPRTKPTVQPEAETEKVEAQPNETALSDPSSAVIGRYEADGTSYIMYADGSIEAQSEAGVFRFGSMAELRAHIEG